MPSIHIARHGQSIGSFSEEEVREGISSKRFSEEGDLAWTSGMTEWRPLSEVRAAWQSHSSSTDSAMITAVLTEPAWERRSELGFFKALFQTIFSILFSPSETFSKMKITGGLGAPLLFYVITHVLVVPLTCLCQAQMTKDFFAFVPWFTAHAAQPKIAKMLHDVALGASLQKVMMLGLNMIIYFFMTAAFFHLSLKILKSARGPFEATFRMLCYCYGAYAFIGTLFGLVTLAVSRLGLIPINIRISIYTLETLIGVSILGALYFIGLKQVHHLSSWRTTVVLLLAMLLPVLMSLAVILLIALLIALVLVAKHFMH
jgi:hypothetical protein